MPDGSGPGKSDSAHSAPGFVGALYGRTASFGRDVFHYVVTGTVFVFVGSVPWWPQVHNLLKSRLSELQPIVTDAGVQAPALLVAGILLFCMGHVLLSVGFCIRKLWKRMLCCCDHVKQYKRAIGRVKRLNGDHDVVAECRDAHIGLEMRVFLRQRDVHANYIERYNTLWHFRLGLAASLLSSGLFNMVVGCVWCICPLPVFVGAVGIGFGLLLMRQHWVTNTSFLNRVVVAFNIAQEIQKQEQEAKKRGTQP